MRVTRPTKVLHLTSMLLTLFSAYGCSSDAEEPNSESSAMLDGGAGTSGETALAEGAVDVPVTGPEGTETTTEMTSRDGENWLSIDGSAGERLIPLGYAGLEPSISDAERSARRFRAVKVEYVNEGQHVLVYLKHADPVTGAEFDGLLVLTASGDALAQIYQHGGQYITFSESDVTLEVTQTAEGDEVPLLTLRYEPEGPAVATEMSVELSAS